MPSPPRRYGNFDLPKQQTHARKRRFSHALSLYAVSRIECGGIRSTSRPRTRKQLKPLPESFHEILMKLCCGAALYTVTRLADLVEIRALTL